MTRLRLPSLVLASALVAGALTGLAPAANAAAPADAPASAPAATATTRTYTLPELVAAIPPAPPLYNGYTGAEQFIPKAVAAKKDARGCNLAQRTTIALATVKPKVGKGCKMTGGTWVIDGGTKTVKSVKGLKLVPVMPYKMAWGQGAYAWTPAQRLAWATSTGPSKQGRSSAVVTQSSQTLMSHAYIQQVRDLAYRAAEPLGATFWSIWPTCQTNRMSAGDCIALAGFIATWSGGLTQGTEACVGIAQRAANLRAWGLTVDGAFWSDTYWIGTDCIHIDAVSVSDQTAINGIAPARSPFSAPSTFVPATQPLFDGYGTPQTAPATKLFGLLAPVDWGDPQVSVDSLRLWDAGVSWRQIEVAPDVYDWSTLDRTVAMAQRTGASLSYVLGDTPGWANGGAAGNVPPTNLDDAAGFIRAVCARYQGSIAQYEAWNEGNIVEFWSGTPEQLADLTNRVYQSVKSCGSNAEVLASSAGARASGGMATRYQPYLTALGSIASANGGQWPMSAVSVHSYPAANGSPVDRAAILKQWSAMLDLSGVPTSMPRYDGELNYGLAGLGQARVPIDQATGAAWLAQSYVQSMQFGIETLSWFLWTGARGDYDKLGIQFNTGTPTVKQSWSTTRDWLYGARMQRCAQRDNLMACQLTNRFGANMTIAYAVAGEATIDPTGLGTLVCTLAGSCEAVGGRTAVTVGAAPVKIA